MSAYRLSPRITSWMQSYSTADIHIYIYHIAQLMASAFRGGGSGSHQMALMASGVGYWCDLCRGICMFSPNYMYTYFVFKCFVVNTYVIYI